MLFKVNHLVDPQIIDELYTASSAGCSIDLIVRGNCCIRAGVRGLSDNIRVRSIVGKFLEHSRIYRFGRPGRDAVYYIGSADMMQRNLNGRVEALVPVTDSRIKARLEQILEVEMSDDALAWEMRSDGTWRKVPNERNIDTHRVLEELAVERARGDEMLAPA
jgi:polyphosphate kinase